MRTHCAYGFRSILIECVLFLLRFQIRFGGDDTVYEQTAQTLEAEVAVVYHLLSAEKK